MLGSKVIDYAQNNYMSYLRPGYKVGAETEKVRDRNCSCTAKVVHGDFLLCPEPWPLNLPSPSSCTSP